MTFKGDPRTSSPGWRRLRKQVLERDGHRCTWMDQGRRCEAPATEVDHELPVSKGGKDELGNLRSLCSAHHARKTAAEGNEARWRHRRRREEPPHPGLI